MVDHVIASILTSVTSAITIVIIILVSALAFSGLILISITDSSAIWDMLRYFSLLNPL